MRPCQPYLVALRRSLVMSSLLGGVQVGLWLVAAIVLARVIDARLASQTVAQTLPWTVAMLIAVTGALVLELTRATLRNRRDVWLSHSLGEKVVEHEVWMAADARQRARCLAAVAALAQFAGSAPARIVVDLPWLILAIGALWFIDMDVAVVASAAAFLLLLIMLSGARLSNVAQTFDTGLAAHTDGDAVIRMHPISSDAGPDQARAIARHWEATQRHHLSQLYATGQAYAQRAVGAATIGILACLMLAAIILERPVVDAQTPGTTAAVIVVTLAIIAMLAQGALHAPIFGRARAARKHLLLLRRTRNRQSDHVVARPTGPDLRAPMAASLIVAIVAVGGIVATALHWELAFSELLVNSAQIRTSHRTSDAAPTTFRAGRKDQS